MFMRNQLACLKQFFLLIVVIICFLIYLIALTSEYPRKPSSHFNKKLPSRILFKSNGSNGDNRDPFIVHYVRLNKDEEIISKSGGLCFLECLSLLSVMVNLQLDWVYIHTNIPGFLPHFFCQNMSIDWSKVKIIESPLTRVISETNIKNIEHEADIKKLESVYLYGGVALDFDVYVINGSRIRELLQTYECIVSREQTILNAGFLACHPYARFPQEVLDSYDNDFHPDAWLHNSGYNPMEIYKRNPSAIHLDDTIANSPPWSNRSEMTEKHGIHDWTTKLAYHVFLHNCSFGPADLVKSTSSFEELLRWIAEKGGYHLPGKVTELTVLTPATSTNLS